MPRPDPIITIGMPVYNDVNFIEDSLKSILSQSEKNFKLIISDDCSTDGSQDICETYEKKDSRIEFIRREKNIGISKNMEFLLSKSDTKYFMWAGDDDLWDKDFVKNLIALLEGDSDSIVAFCIYHTINQNTKQKIKEIDINYENKNKFKSLNYFIRNPDDGFGYGIFKTEKIKNVCFPSWHWPNRKTAYNNIYPSLCYYLAKGKYMHYSEKPLFYKRVKENNKINHKVAGNGNGVLELLAYYIRRLNLVFFSIKEIIKANGVILSLFCLPKLLLHWFVLNSFKETYSAIKYKMR